MVALNVVTITTAFIKRNMYSSQHITPSSRHRPSSVSPPTDNNDVSNASDFFTANLVSIAAEASNVGDEVSLNHQHHHQHHHRAHHSDVDVDLDNIHKSIEHLVNEGRTSAPSSKEFQRQLEQQFSRDNGELSTTDIEQTTNALMQMAQSSLAHQSELNSPTLSKGGSSTTRSLGKLNSTERGNDDSRRTKISELEDKDKNALKKACEFCGKTFSHPGSLGRHLDLKRGTRLHPAAEIDLIRADVKRRGDAVEIKTRRAKRARVYNSREDVKERARIRRKSKERNDRAHAAARQNFIERIGLPSLPPHPSFAYVVLYFLPPAQWPHDPPTTQTYGHLEQALQPLENLDFQLYNDYTNKINVAFEQWSVMNKQSKMEIWAREQRRVAEAALGRLSLCDLGSREIWLKVEEDRILTRLNQEAEEEDGEGDATKSLDESDQENEEVRDSGLEGDKADAGERNATMFKQEPDLRRRQERSSGRDNEDDSNVLDPAITKHPSSSVLLKDHGVSGEVDLADDSLELIIGHNSRLTGSVHVVNGPASYERSLI